jgi:XTP/dITP diphosphohydrolase
MKLVLATGNKGKLREFQQMCEEKVTAFSELLGDMEIVEDGDPFAANALIKARTIYEKLGEVYLVISDDSGISLPLLDGAPGIYSARYAGEGASDKDNLYKLIDAVKSKGLKETPAYYTAAIAIVSKYGEYVVHGWMHGKVIGETRGEKGFGYDPMFIPTGFDKTLGELNDDIKSEISHRGKALALAKPIIQMLKNK